MSTNYGRTTTSGNDTWVQNTGSNNQYGFVVTSVPQGQVSFLDVYMAGSGGTCRTILCLWNSSGVLIAQTAQFSAGAGSGGVNGQSLRRQAISGGPIQIAGGTYYVGFWRNPADTAEWSYNAGTGIIRPQAPGAGVANVSSPSNLNTGSLTSGQMTAYLEWDPGNIYNGPSGGGAPATIQGVYQGPSGSGAPIAVPGVYQGPSGGGAPVQIF